MRLIVVHPGASTSTHDVHAGLVKGLRSLGHEVFEYRLDGHISAAGAYLSYIWRRQKGKALGVPRPNGADVLYLAGNEITLHVARLWPVDWIIHMSGMYLHPDYLVFLRNMRVRQGIVLTESPYDDDLQNTRLPYVDIAWTNERTSARPASGPGMAAVHYLPHAYDPDRHTPRLRDATAPAPEVVFVGSYFEERQRLLEAVDWTGIDLGLYGAWDDLGSRSKLRRYVRGSVIDNADAVRLYLNAKIGLNLYRTSKGFGRGAPKITHAESLNPRAYELAACGVFQVSEARSEVFETFRGWVPDFKDARGLEILVREYLDESEHGTGRRARHAAQARELVRGHTYTARAQQMVDDLIRYERAHVGPFTIPVAGAAAPG